MNEEEQKQNGEQKIKIQVNTRKIEVKPSVATQKERLAMSGQIINFLLKAKSDGKVNMDELQQHAFEKLKTDTDLPKSSNTSLSLRKISDAQIQTEELQLGDSGYQTSKLSSDTEPPFERRLTEYKSLPIRHLQALAD